MQITPFKLMAMCLLAMVILGKPSQAQFIRFNLTIPPGFAINEQIKRSEVVETRMTDNGMNELGNNQSNYRWLEIRTNENVPIIIEAALNGKYGLPAAPLLYLNNGTSNFTEAFALPRRGATVDIYKSNAKLAKTQITANYISAWLGVPTESSGSLTIIYP
jgi:hypothetical protein